MCPPKRRSCTRTCVSASTGETERARETRARPQRKQATQELPPALLQRLRTRRHTLLTQAPPSSALPLSLSSRVDAGEQEQEQHQAEASAHSVQVDALMQKSVVRDGEKAQNIRGSSKKAAPAPKWEDFHPTQMTPEIKRDLQLLSMRNHLDAKRFYKSLGWKKLPTNIQQGVIVESKADFYSGRLTNRQRKRTMLEELQGAGETMYAKKRYKSMQAESVKEALRKKAKKKAIRDRKKNLKQKKK